MKKKAFVTNKGEVITGKLTDITVDDAGILRVKLYESKKAIVSLQLRRFIRSVLIVVEE